MLRTLSKIKQNHESQKELQYISNLINEEKQKLAEKSLSKNKNIANEYIIENSLESSRKEGSEQQWITVSNIMPAYL